MTSNKRKSVFINPKFQTTFIAFVFLACFLTILIFLTSNYIFFNRFESLGLAFGIPANSAFFTFIARQKSIMGNIFLVTATVNFILIGILGVLFSHRISGPLHRLEKYLLETSPDKLHSIKSRKGDYFPELVIALNSFISKINSKNDP